MKQWKRLAIFIIALIISCSLVGCNIGDADIMAKAAQATWQLSPDGYNYAGYIEYAGQYWYFTMNIITNNFSFGSWTESQMWQNVVGFSQKGWTVANWEYLPDIVRLSLVEVVKEVLPISPVWTNFFIILPVCTTCSSPLLPTPQVT